MDVQQERRKLVEHGVLGTILSLLVVSQTWTGLRLVETLEHGQHEARKEQERYISLLRTQQQNELSATIQRERMIESHDALRIMVQQNLDAYKYLDKQRLKSEEEREAAQRARAEQSAMAIELLSKMLERLESIERQSK